MGRTRKKRAAPAPTGTWRDSVKLREFIAALSKTGNVSDALRLAKASRAWIYEKRQTDHEFEMVFEEARRCGLEVLRDEAHRRAYSGVAEPVFYQGEEVATVQKYSDTLLMFLIKQADPSFREHFNVDVGNTAGRPFMFQVQLHPEAVAAAQPQPGETK